MQNPAEREHFFQNWDFFSKHYVGQLLDHSIHLYMHTYTCMCVFVIHSFTYVHAYVYI